MRSATITLGGVQYTINELPSRKAAAWRQLMQTKLAVIANLIESAPETDITSGVALAQLINAVGASLIRSTDTIIELLFEYAPILNEKMRDGNIDFYDSELIAAFVEVVKLAYPFGHLANLLARFGSGAASRPT